MRFPLALLALLLTIAPASAIWFNWPPPARFDKGPTLFNSPVFVWQVNQVQYKAACLVSYAYGCTMVPSKAGGRCYIFINTQFKKGTRDYAWVLRHEMGHCRGWPQGHPQ